jgi:AmiR/NasT family two-component response regulator
VEGERIVDPPKLNTPAMATQSPFEHSAEINQAAGMVSVQADCDIEDAFALMFERADSAGVSLDDIAAAVP